MMDIVEGLDSWFAERLKGLDSFRPETIAYVTSVLARKRWEASDMSRESVVLAFHDATLRGDFERYQRIGDWVLFIDTVHPEHLNGVRETIESIGRNSYYSCYRILRGKWKLYEDLADQLPTLAQHVRRKLL